MEEILFPYKELRKVQKAFMLQVLHTAKNKQNLIIHAPTGTGKTVSILSPLIPYALKNNKTIFFLTPMHSQHKIVIETIKEIKEKFNLKLIVVDLIGKKWMCPVSGTDLISSSEFSEYCREVTEKETCDYYNNMKDPLKRKVALQEINRPMHVEEVCEISKRNIVCPFEISCELAKRANIIIADYYHILNQSIRTYLFKKINKEMEDSILVFDEAHNLISKCRDLLTVNLSTITLDRALRESKEFGFEFDDEISVLMNLFNLLANDLPLNQYENLLKKEDFNFNKGLIEKFRKAAERIIEDKKRSSLASVSNFLESWLGPDEGFIRILSRNFTKSGKPYINMAYKCLDPSFIFSSLNPHSSILMSGTLTPTLMYLDMLGLEKEKTIISEYTNPFPIKNRLSLIIPKTTTKFTRRNEDMYKKISRYCSMLINTIPGNIAVFFPSYRLRDEVYSFLQTTCEKTTFLEQPKMNKQEKNDLLEKFKSYKDRGAVLLGVSSGSFAEGIDLPGDYLKAVLIVGLPLAKPDLETKELINYYDKRFSKGWDYGYTFPAMIKSIQGAGRCIRSETDKGVIIFLDERYAWQNYYKCFPVDYSFKITDNPLEEINKFFDN